MVTEGTVNIDAGLFDDESGGVKVSCLMQKNVEQCCAAFEKSPLYYRASLSKLQRQQPQFIGIRGFAEYAAGPLSSFRRVI